jgi:hypothetical protein
MIGLTFLLVLHLLRIQTSTIIAMLQTQTLFRITGSSGGLTPGRKWDAEVAT